MSESLSQPACGRESISRSNLDPTSQTSAVSDWGPTITVSNAVMFRISRLLRGIRSISTMATTADTSVSAVTATAAASTATGATESAPPTTAIAPPRVPIPPRGVDYRGKVVLAPMVRSGELPLRLVALHYGADLVWGTPYSCFFFCLNPFPFHTPPPRSPLTFRPALSLITGVLTLF